MTAVEVTIGWTKYPNEQGGAVTLDGRVHIPFWDGYVPGMPQHTETVTVEVDTEWRELAAVVEHIAEEAYKATNSPEPTRETGLAQQIYLGVLETGYRGEGAHYSLSIGDTVTVGEVTLGCTREGWQRVVMPPT